LCVNKDSVSRENKKTKGYIVKISKKQSNKPKNYMAFLIIPVGFNKINFL